MYISDSLIYLINLMAGNYCLFFFCCTPSVLCQSPFRERTFVTLDCVTLLLWTGLGPRTLFQQQCLLCSTGKVGTLDIVSCSEAPHLVGSSSWWVLSEPCQYIPCPRFPTKWSYVVIVHHNIKWKYSCIGILK